MAKAVVTTRRMQIQNTLITEIDRRYMYVSAAQWKQTGPPPGSGEGPEPARRRGSVSTPTQLQRNRLTTEA